MLEFTCTACGGRIQSHDASDKGIECPYCHAIKTAPGGSASSPATSVATPEDAALARIAQPLPPPAGAFSEGPPPLSELLPAIRKEVPGIVARFMSVVVVAAIVLVLVAMLVPSVRRVREASARTQSTNNLKQLALSFAAFHDAHKRLPFNGADGVVGGDNYTTVAVADNPTSGSWAFQLLPYIDQGPMFKDGPVNRHLTRGIATFLNPGRGRPAFAAGAGVQSGPWTDYFLNIYINTDVRGNNAWSQPDARRTMTSIIDGTSETIAVGDGTIAIGLYSINVEFAGAGTIWTGGTEGTARGGADVLQVGAGPNVVLQPDIAGVSQPPSPISWGGPFPQGGLMGLLDGTVHMFPYSISGTTFGAFLTPANGENVTPPN